MVVAQNNSQAEETRQNLISLNLKEGEDFFHYKKWMRHGFETLYREFNVLHQDYVELYITDKCSLRCKACSLMMPYLKSHQDRELSVIKKDVEAYFRVVDYVNVLRILGGEPFLFDKLFDLLTFIGENYRKQAGRIYFVSNGTILPREDVLNAIREYDMEVLISDYPVDFAQKQREKLLQHLTEHGVKYSIKYMDSWADTFGNPHERKHEEEAELKQLFKACNYRCRTMYEGKLWYCSADCAAQRQNIVTGDAGDYVNLVADASEIIRKKEELLTFDNGNVPKGYVSFCRNCYGGTDCNGRFIPVGEQVEQK